jgi:steroid delta-isomerase
VTDPIEWTAPDHDHPARTASRRSLSLVAAKDKAGWLANFADDATVEDPVGPSFLDPDGNGHRGAAGIGAFWDLAIAPVQQFRIRITDSHANGVTCANVGTITTRFEDGTVVDTDLMMVYTVDEAGKVASLRAYWEPDRAMATARKE